MKKIFFLLLVFLAFANGNAQILDPVKWTSKTEKISDTEFNLVFEGVIDEGWHMYSQFTPDGGPLPLELKFAAAKGNYNLVGKAVEGKTKREYNDVFEVDEIFFEKKVVIKQKVKITNPKTTKISVEIDYQVCKDACINQNKSFQFTIPAIPITEVITANIDTTSVSKDTVQETATENKADIVPISESIKQPEKEEKKGLLTIFIIAFFSGFAAGRPAPG